MKRIRIIILLTIVLTSCVNSKKENQNIPLSENKPTKSEFKKIQTNNSLELEYQILDENDQQIEFSRLEKIAEYPGGFDSLEVFIQRNFEFPEETKNMDIVGTVETTFNVSKIGEVVEIEIKKGLRKEIDQACIEIISKLPNWKPAELRDGEKVKMKFLLPLKFVIEE
jgi:outer membrane biosynthesis protein TonB